MKTPTPAAQKDLEAAHPVPGEWRPVLCEVVLRFVSGDYALSDAIAHVEPIDQGTAEQVRNYIADYGATLIGLPEETWSTSVVQWYGSHWEFLVDLWTEEEGRSDLVLSGRVHETGGGYAFKIHLVYVP